MFKFFVFVVYVVLPFEISKAASKTNIIVHNNGPAVLGANITFSSVLTGYPKSTFIYVFDDGVQKKDEFTSTSFKQSLSKAFPSDLYNEGRYCMNVTVKVNKIFYNKEIAKNYTCFDLKRYLIGEILIYQGNKNTSEGVEEVAIGEDFTAVIDLYDPNNFLKDAVIDYSWSLDMDTHLTLNSSILYNFTDVGEKRIIAKPTATFPDFSVSGFFTKTVTAKVPVNNVNVSGNPFLHHGDFLMLNISCYGTPPFEYCSEILKENVTLDEFTCSQVSIFTSCHMEIKKFLTDGKYQMGIYIGNDVREVKKIIEIMVYNVSIKPTLSTVIIPIICSLLTLIIIAIGISYYIQQRNQLAVEVADFDFQDESDSYSGERTFFEKIFDSFSCRNCGRNQLSCVRGRNESDPLLTDESLPYV